MSKLIRVSEYAKLKNISVAYVYRMMYRGTGKGQKKKKLPFEIIGGYKFIKVED